MEMGRNRKDEREQYRGEDMGMEREIKGDKVGQRAPGDGKGRRIGRERVILIIEKRGRANRIEECI